jgi:signal recognition particle subunit SRP54
MKKMKGGGLMKMMRRMGGLGGLVGGGFPGMPPR